ncbi:hypothetical protein [Pseudomonas saponiphila]|uniref:hypothetical protein n=1 Tax=Pseudomonas saponiphila TaxID=556534 RepID=UPI00223F0E12|nr:hypothetical protein [Pseudomonas saponiphila]
MKRMHVVVVRLPGTRGKPNQMHLHRDGRRRVIPIAQTGQTLQPFPPSILSPDLSQGGGNLLRNTVRAGAIPQENPRARRPTRSTAPPLHDGSHRASHTATGTIQAALLAPVVQQLFDFLNHRAIPLKIEPDTKNAMPNTNPTQINPFKINIFINFELGVLGVLGLSVLA